jgi:hypothetical protein
MGGSASRWAAAQCACLAAVCCTSLPATADEPNDAAASFREGTAAFDRGDYRAAALAFEAAHRRAPHPSALYNAARAWEAGGDRGRAADAFVGALAAGLEGAQRRDAEQRVGVLGPSLARLRVSAPPGSRVSVGHLERREPPAEAYVEPGEYEVRVELPDRRHLSRRVSVGAGEHTLAFEAPPAAAPRAEPRAVASSPPATGSPVRIAGFVGLGTAAALGGAAIALGVATVSARDRWDDDGHRNLSLRDDAVTLRTWTNVAAFSAAAVGAAGLILVLVAPSASTAPARPGVGAWSSELRF